MYAVVLFLIIAILILILKEKKRNEDELSNSMFEKLSFFKIGLIKEPDNFLFLQLYIDTLFILLLFSKTKKYDSVKATSAITQLDDSQLTFIYPTLYSTFYNLEDKEFKQFIPFFYKIFEEPQLCAVALRRNDTRFLEFCNVDYCVNLKPEVFV